MATNEPMTDEALAEIDAYWNLIYHGYYMPDIPEPPDTLHDAICHILELRAEVDRLRAREQALVAENAAAIDELEWQRDMNQQLGAENEQKQAQIDAMRPIVEEVAAGAEYASDLGDAFHCLWCDGEDVEQRDVQHDNGCPVTQARAFLAAHPATAAAAESEGE